MPQQTKPEYRASWAGPDGTKQYSDSSLTLESVKSIALDHHGDIEVSHGTGWEPYTEPGTPAPAAAPAAPAETPVAPVGTPAGGQDTQNPTAAPTA